MGNLCGKESGDDNFNSPGRTVASAPAPRTTSSIPSSASRKVGGPPQKLGGTSVDGGGHAAADAQADARRKAAEAAQARAAAANKPSGRLGGKLADQKKQSRIDTLNETSKTERRMRDADSAAETRAYA